MSFSISQLGVVAGLPGVGGWPVRTNFGGLGGLDLVGVPKLNQLLGYLILQHKDKCMLY